VGERYNPKRPFIFVSKVLGKHWPVSPLVMKGGYEDLAAKLNDLESPVLFVAMAETAIGLGRGVFAEYGTQYGAKEALFTQTTRYQLNHKIALEIDEPHCHARSHLVYWPKESALAQLFLKAKTLVLIDDEISTGNTLKNLAQAYLNLNKGLKRLILVSLMSFLSDAVKEEFQRAFPPPVDHVSLLEGTFNYDPGEISPEISPSFNSVGDFAPKDWLLQTNYGRLGLRFEDDQLYYQTLAKSFHFSPSQKVRVIGTGEFLREPFNLAYAFSQLGYETLFQSTTRTPLAPSPAISHTLAFPDNYHDNIDNFIYNLDPNFEGDTVIVYETRPLPLDHDLPTRLRAKVLFL
jgi:hypothetical protein